MSPVAPSRPRPAVLADQPRRQPWRRLARAVSWHRRKLAVLAALAAVLTGFTALAPGGPPSATVVRARSQLAAGAVLRADDLVTAPVPEAGLPDGSLTDPGPLVGRTLAGAVAEGQVLTELALATSRTVPPGHVVAPLRLADPGVAALLRPGDLVDVLAADDQSGTAAVVATAVRVLTVPEPADADHQVATGALVLFDLDAPTATRAFAAAASKSLSVIWR